ncbi:MAG: hypothetical protein WBW31_01085 [Candidatus Sulfotelmatobacter sp.]
MVQERGVVPNPLTEQELKRLVLEAINAATYAETLETYHALYGHMDRGIETDDVIHGLEGEWQFERQPQFNRAFWQWKYYIATETVDGDPITIVIAVDSWRREFTTVTRWRQN